MTRYPTATHTDSDTQQPAGLSLPIAPVFKEDKVQAATLAKHYAFQLIKPYQIPTANTRCTAGNQSSAHHFALYLTLEAGKLSLLDATRPKEAGVSVDFASDALEYRVKHGGGKQEFVARAVGIKGQEFPTVLDATGGLGKDAFILSSLGCRVTLVERSPVVAALLDNGLERASLNVELANWLPHQLTLKHANSITLMQNWQAEAPDVIYLDPMFPHRKKSAAVKKEMRLFQQLLGVDPDSDALLAPAMALAKTRVVVKRPANAPYLAERKPQAKVSSKKHRFDIYLRT